jgi:asparaginyl-tRNA synthetase
LEVAAAVWTYPLIGLSKMENVPQQVLDQAKKDVTRALNFLNNSLKGKSFLVGKSVTIADIAVAAALWQPFTLVIDASQRSSVPALDAWFQKVTSMSQFAGVFGAFKGAGGSAPAPAAPSGGSGGGSAAPSGLNGSGLNPDGGSATILRPVSNPWVRCRMRLKEVFLKGLKIEGETVTIKGWVRTLRDQKHFAFCEMNDGSCMKNLQCVLTMAGEFETSGYAAALKCGGTGASLSITGKIIKSPAKGQTVELQATSVEVLGTVDGAKYPLSKKRHSAEKMRELAHLRPRTNGGGAAMRMRHAMAYATHAFFNEKGFLYIHTPCITASDCEGAGEMFQCTTLLPQDHHQKLELGGKDGIPVTDKGAPDYSKDFFAKPAYLTVSGQLNVETHACALSDVYTFGPTFRAENSHTSRHLAEFWMIEPEICFADLEDDMALAEEYVKFCAQYALDNCKEDLAHFEARVEKGLIARLENVIASPFGRLTYTDAIAMLLEPKHVKAGKFKTQVYWGYDLDSEHERYLCEKVYKRPLIVTDYPKEIKAFYMRINEDGKTVRAMDILVPKIGELIGGSQREERLDKLEEAIIRNGDKLEDYSWYADLRRYGSVPHAGFGLGFERMVMFVTGIENIRDVIPFPRYPGHADF